MTKNILAVVALLLAFQSFAQDPFAAKCKKNVLIVSYNVENLFDTLDNPHKIDNDFLPAGKKQWNSARYYEKLKHLAEVIASVDKHKLPDLLGLVEIENRAVLVDLKNQAQLKKGHYEILHKESPDMRGIDVALLYNRKKFSVLDTQFLKVSMPENKRFKTRDILYAKLLFKKTGDTLHIFVNHWPSRRGGQEKSAPKRMLAAKSLRHITDSLFSSAPAPLIVIMGDFNDETTNKSITEGLEAVALGHKLSPDSLYNTARAADLQNKGTYYYWRTKEWNMLDQMIISGGFQHASPKHLRVLWQQMGIHREDFFLYTNKEGVKSPAKTYGGKKYYGGYSDHLPVYFYLYYKVGKKCL